MQKLTGALSRARKAVVGAVLAGGPLTLAALTEQSPGGTGIERSEWIAIAVTAAVAFAGVYNVSNEPAA